MNFRGGQRGGGGVSRGSVDPGSVFCCSPKLTAISLLPGLFSVAGVQGLLDVQLFRSCSNHGGISSSSSPSFL